MSLHRRIARTNSQLRQQSAFFQVMERLNLTQQQTNQLLRTSAGNEENIWRANRQAFGLKKDSAIGLIKAGRSGLNFSPFRTDTTENWGSGLARGSGISPSILNAWQLRYATPTASQSVVVRKFIRVWKINPVTNRPDYILSEGWYSFTSGLSGQVDLQTLENDAWESFLDWFWEFQNKPSVFIEAFDGERTINRGYTR